VAFTVAKDGTILRWDLETMKRTQLIRWVCTCVKCVSKRVLVGRGEKWLVGQVKDMEQCKS